MSSRSVQRRFGALKGGFFAALLDADLWPEGAAEATLGIGITEQDSFGVQHTLVVWRVWHCSSPLVPCVWRKYNTEPEGVDQPLKEITSDKI